MNKNSQTQPIDIKAIQDLIKDDFQAVNARIKQALSSDVALINELGAYIISSGGKRLRPMITLLCAGVCGYQGNAHITAAALIEFIHTATLLHDDVVDHSDLRRGKETANAIWGNEASVLVGDFLYTRSFQMMVSINSMNVMNILADATNKIAEGEVMQVLNIGDAETNEARYMDVIYSKTAKLFEAAGRVAGMIAHEHEQKSSDYAYHLAEYGKFLGTAFQLVDDILDYTTDATTMGKNTGDDLAEGKPTLPLIYAMAHGTTDEIEFIQKAITDPSPDNLPKALAIITRTDALDYTAKKAQEQAQLAIDSLSIFEESPYKTALINLARYSVDRSF